MCTWLLFSWIRCWSILLWVDRLWPDDRPEVVVWASDFVAWTLRPEPPPPVVDCTVVPVTWCKLHSWLGSPQLGQSKDLPLSAAARAHLCFSINCVTIDSTVSAVWNHKRNLSFFSKNVNKNNWIQVVLKNIWTNITNDFRVYAYRYFQFIVEIRFLFTEDWNKNNKMHFLVPLCHFVQENECHKMKREGGSRGFYQ